MADSEEELDEQDLARALLLLWVLMDPIDLRSSAGRRQFDRLFDQHVGPTAQRVYDRARGQTLSELGSSTQRPSSAGVMQLADDVYRDFQGRQASIRDAEQTSTAIAAVRPVPAQPAELPTIPLYDAMGAERDGITANTMLITAGTVNARDTAAADSGKRYATIWLTEPGACDVCAPLDGTTHLWRTLFPNGPPAHPRCRCRTELREIA